MSKWTKSPQELVDLFYSVMPPEPPVELRKMFGYPAAFTGGNMFAGLFQDDMILRLPQQTREALIREGGVQFEPMPGRPMKEYVAVPASMHRDAQLLAGFAALAADYAATLPVKAKKPPAKKAAAKKATKKAK